MEFQEEFTRLFRFQEEPDVAEQMVCKKEMFHVDIEE